LRQFANGYSSVFSKNPDMKQSSKLSRRAYLTTSAGALAGASFLADSTFSWAEPSGKPGATGLPKAESGKRKQLFRFLHSYEATGRYWQGLEKAGLIIGKPMR
jgi:hypothetical protein